nr:altronate dehydratase family protein [uncultured Pseudomonas sp.]
MNKDIINPFIRLDPNDNVIVARTAVAADVEVPSEGLTTLHDIPAGHKVVTTFLAKGDPVLKYNTIIGYAGEDVPPGTWMHSHNILFDEVVKDYAFAQGYQPTHYIPPAERAIFQGIVREDGAIATRNFIGIFVLGNAAGTVARKIADGFKKGRLEAFPNVDGVVAYVHQQGDTMEASGEAIDMLRRTISGFIRNPNIAAALIVAQGSEVNDLLTFLRSENLQLGANLKTLIIDQEGGSQSAIIKGRELVAGMLSRVNEVRRQPVSAEHLIVGLQCGGSDGFSGLSANPALGAAVDILVRHGGTAILSETSEIFGVEQTLTRRACSREVGQKLVDRMNWWLEYNAGRDTQLNGKVSPGNNAGGIANVLEKSLGGAKKGGNSPLMEVYEFAQPVTEYGLVFMDTPGYDPCSATGQIAGGANMVMFTTGRGSCFGSTPSPTIKLASNTPMYERMVADMDINCGVIIDGIETLPELGQKIFEALLWHASGERTKSEISGVGENEFVPWPLAVMC